MHLRDESFDGSRRNLSGIARAAKRWAAGFFSAVALTVGAYALDDGAWAEQSEVAEELSQEENGCSLYAGNIRFAKTSPSSDQVAGFAKRIQTAVTYIEPEDRIEAELSGLDGIIEDHDGFPDFVTGTVDRIAHLAKAGPVHVEVYGFSKDDSISQNRADLLSISLQAGIVRHNATADEQIFIPYIPSYKVADEGMFGPHEDDNQRGLVVVRPATEPEIRWQAEQTKRLRAGMSVDIPSFPNDVGDIAFDISIVDSLYTTLPGDTLCVPASAADGAKRQKMIRTVLETFVGRQKGVTKRQRADMAKMGFVDLTEYVLTRGVKSEQLGRIISLDLQGLDKVVAALTGRAPSVGTSGVTCVSPDKLLSRGTNPLSEESPLTIQEIEDRYWQLSQHLFRLRRAAYDSFSVRVTDDGRPYTPECSDFCDNDRDGVADYKGVVYRGGHREYERDPDCDSPADDSEAPHPCEHVPRYLVELNTQITEARAGSSEAKARSCVLVQTLRQMEKTGGCVTGYAELRKAVRDAWGVLRPIKAGYVTFCETHDCRMPGYLFPGKHLLSVTDDIRDMYRDYGVKGSYQSRMEKIILPEEDEFCGVEVRGVETEE